MDLWNEIKDYFYYIYMIVIGYLTWNHKRVDKVIQDSARIDQEIDDIKDNVKHIRDGVDRLSFHLLRKDNKNG